MHCVGSADVRLCLSLIVLVMLRCVFCSLPLVVPMLVEWHAPASLCLATAAKQLFVSLAAVGLRWQAQLEPSVQAFLHPCVHLYTVAAVVPQPQHDVLKPDCLRHQVACSVAVHCNRQCKVPNWATLVQLSAINSSSQRQQVCIELNWTPTNASLLEVCICGQVLSPDAVPRYLLPCVSLPHPV